VLASEAKALFGYGVPARFDAEIIADRGALGGGAAEDRTMFFGVRQVPPAHLLIATRGHLRTVRYWDFDFPPIGHERPGTDEEDIERLHQAVDEAVRLRLRADVPVACYLSGGLDSSAVLGYAASHYAGPIKAFTLSFDRPEYDEEPIARAMAQHVGADYFAIPVSQSDFAREFSDAVWHAERPLVNANGVAKFMLSRAVRDAGIKVVLTGEGADEIFAGYPHFRRDLIIQRGGSQHELTALADTNQVSRGMLMPDGEGLSTQAVRTALGFVPSWIEAMASAAKKLQPLRRAAPDQPAARDALPAFLSSIEISRQLRGRHPLHQSMYVWARSMLPNFILTVLGDRMEMAHSLEGRLPFLDHHVVELATRLHPDRLIRGGTEKWILRQIARPMITPKVYERQKHPFVAPPIVSSPEGALYIQMQDTLRSVAARSMPLFDARQLVALLDSLPKLDLQTLTALDTPLMAMFSSCILQQRFAVQEPSGSLYDADPATRPAG
jgi:asparagine synthase (glutamine-hydrolysing)